jgi:hypothetical protein
VAVGESWMRVKKGEKGGLMEGEAGGCGWEGGMPWEVSMVGRGAERGRYVFVLSGGSLLRGREGRNKGGILDGRLLGYVGL